MRKKYFTDEEMDNWPEFRGIKRLFINKHQWKMFEEAGWEMDYFILQNERVPTE